MKRAQILPKRMKKLVQLPVKAHFEVPDIARSPKNHGSLYPRTKKQKQKTFGGKNFCFGDRAAAENGFRKKPARDFETNRYFRFFHLQPSSCQASVHFKLGPISCQRHRTRDKSLDKIVFGLSRLEPFIFLTYELLRRFRIKISVYSKI